MNRSIISIIFVFILLQGCAYAIRYDSDCRGKVIDVDTSDPIEGVVVLGVWYKEYPTVAGIMRRYHDARETVTDKHGEFRLHGMGIELISNVERPDITVFKSGYSYSSLFWEPGFLPYKSKIKWEGSKAIIPLRKLAIVERKKNIPPPPPGEAPYKKIKLMLDEYNKNHKELGLGIIDVWRDMK